jgi:lipopolysaccharide/colanic/teichoic acid biosynthesis glycosyltransferase
MKIGEFGATAAASVALPPVLQTPLSWQAEWVKRAEDLVLGLLLILAFSPVLFAIACAIKLTSRGPVLFRQQRRGRDNIPFACYKFRTMHHGQSDPGCRTQTVQDDPRVTAVGKFLRRRSLDELPQLFNVVAGDMSLVGPRPHAVGMHLDGTLLPEVLDDYILRYRIRPGMTGWAQVNGWRGIVDTREKLEKRVEFDLHYINHWSLGLDLRILARTFSCMIADERAY